MRPRVGRRALLLGAGAAVLTVIAVLWPVMADFLSSSGSSGPDPSRISTYHADFVIDARGRMQVTETIVVTFPESPARHGIFRFFDIADSYDAGARHIPSGITVTRDGHSEPFTLTWEQDRYLSVRIGSASRYVAPGDHTYVISYRVDGALGPADTPQGRYATVVGTDPGAVGSVFAWHLYAPGWLMTADSVSATVTLPAPAGVVGCAVDRAGAIPCTVTGDGTQTVTVSAENLPASTPVSVRIDLPTAYPGRASLPWSVAWDGVFGRSLLPVLIAVVLALLAWLVGFLWFRSSLEREPGFPVLYEPPKGMGPEQTYLVAREETPSRGLVATLLHQAEQGLTKLEVDGKKWVVRGVGTREDWYKADPVSWDLGASLGIIDPDTTFVCKKSVDAGRRLTQARRSMHAKASSWARSEGYIKGSATEKLGRILVVAAAVITGMGMYFNPFHASVYWLPLPAFVIGGAGLLQSGVGTRRTAKGREAWSRAEGFHRMLSTPSAVDRFDFSARRDLYTAYIPYAVVFGCAEEWARKYRDETGGEPPVPLWFPVGYAWTSADQAVDSFDSTLSSAISAYAATQSSSSSGGGGGFSGGGGGGGGGGSW